MAEDLPLADELATVYARMSGLLLSKETVQTALRLVTALAKDTIPGTVGSGVTLIDERGHRTGTASSDSIKVYSEQPHVFGEREERILTLFAAQAAIPLANMQSLEKAQQLSTGLREALSSRQVIGQAMGIEMAPGGIDETAAFAQLVALSQQQNKKLRDVAEGLVRSTVRRRR